MMASFRPFSLSSPMTTVMLLLFLLLCTTNSATAAAVESAAGGDHRLAPGNNGGCGGFKRMFSFGDSITDAGNLATISPPDASFNRLPYGETFFGHPTGRFCDGRLIVDFLAEGLGLPFLTPFLRAKTPEDFRQGANFAVAGATALSQDFFKKMGLDLTIIPPFSLDVQLEWFKSVLNSLGSTDQERKEIMSKSLFLMGEVGGNDYNHPFFQNRSFTNEIKPLVPKVIAKIENAIKVLIDLGAKTIVVPGNFPIGCVPRYLTMFQSKSSLQDYDEFGCIKWLNDFSVYHNRALKRMLHQIHHDSTVTILYGDYYNTALEITHHPATYGFKKETALVACCGDGGPYNSNSLFGCGGPSTNLCTNPSTHISWDGLHLTEAAYKFVAHHMLHGPYAHQPSISPK
ncbi:GDSL esterase/lipase At1g28610-like isoform X2 [Oryza glaberrima]|uniref:GDSL esterase/lipase At1g28610-like isoform X2 n=1 Tax=Oryza glaberrima TaxID=4538 RepID=UPI00224C1698|nr:GDSL esterase/lipase At1g28610-like isoform X2 [Oryza glaberrima]